MTTISIIVPAFNEAQSISQTLDTLLKWQPQHPYSLDEIIVVNDGSTDATSEIVQEFQIRDCRLKNLINNTNQGKGFSVKRGILASQSHLIGFTDADLAYSPDSYDCFLKPLGENQADLAIGSRFLTQNKLNGYTKRRVISNLMFRSIAILAGLSRVSDSQCGIKFFRRQTALQLFEMIECRGFAFDVELLYYASKLGLRIQEIPVQMTHRANSTVSLWRHAPIMFMELMKIRYRAAGKLLHYKNDHSRA